ncbi:MAG: hypothetical protein AAFV53_38975 [Myxococcota bacterium]
MSTEYLFGRIRELEDRLQEVSNKCTVEMAARKTAQEEAAERGDMIRSLNDFIALLNLEVEDLRANQARAERLRAETVNNISDLYRLLDSNRLGDVCEDVTITLPRHTIVALCEQFESIGFTRARFVATAPRRRALVHRHLPNPAEKDTEE